MASKATKAIERRVNTYTNSDERYSSVTALADGGWLVTWTSNDHFDGQSDDIYQQRFDADGATVGVETRVNTHLASYQTYSSTTMLADGGWVVTWQSRLQVGPGEDIFQQRYGAGGVAVGAEIQVNTTTTGYQEDPDITGLADGGWVVAWIGISPETDDDIYQQRYDTNGNAVGSETRVNSYTTFTQWNTATTALVDGGWVVTWNGDGSGDSSGIFQQRYEADGDKVGSQSRVNSYTTNIQQRSDIAALADGGWIVTWQSTNQDGSGEGIYQQRYEADGDAVSSEVMVNTYTTGDQERSAVTGLADGGWVVAWMSENQDGESDGIYQQRFGADGNKVGSEIHVNVYRVYSELLPQLSALEDGGWVVTWDAGGIKYSGYDVFQRQFDENGVAVNTGSAKADTIKGISAVDVIKGLGGNDKLYGNAGDDTLSGGKGTDKLYGGPGADTFAFAIGDSSAKKSKADTIYDFKGNDGDIIDLTRWDADANMDGIQGLTFIDKQGFHGVAGELRFVKERSDTWISGDTNGDGKADFIIHLDDAVKMIAGHFEGLL